MENQEEIRLCKIFIDKFIEPRSSLNRDKDAYQLKHRVEDWTKKNSKNDCYTYISMESFIQAAKEKGYEPDYPTSRNPHFRVSFKKLKSWMKENYPHSYW